MEENNNTKKGVSAIIYDDKGSNHYFLILRRADGRKRFEFVKGDCEPGEDPIDAVKRIVKEFAGLRNFEVKGNLVGERSTGSDDKKYTTFLVEANMNVVVDISQSENHDSYLWTAKENVTEKLILDDEIASFTQALKILNSGQLK